MIDFFGQNPALAWAALGTVLLIAEILLTSGFFLPFAVSGYIVAILVWAGIDASLLMKGVIFAAVGVALIWPARHFIRRADTTPDINRY